MRSKSALKAACYGESWEEKLYWVVGIKLGLCNAPSSSIASECFPEPTLILASNEDRITQLANQNVFLENQPHRRNHPPTHQKEFTLANLSRILQSENLQRNYFHCNVNKSVESFQRIEFYTLYYQVGEWHWAREGNLTFLGLWLLNLLIRAMLGHAWALGNRQQKQLNKVEAGLQWP